MLNSKYLRIEEQFEALPAQIKLIILHPAAHNEHRIFGQLFLNHAEGAIYVQLNADDGLEMALQRIISAMGEQAGVPVDFSFETGLSSYASQLADILSLISAGFIYLDSYDGDVVSQLDPIIAELVTLLSDRQKVVISGRRLPLTFLADDRLKGQVALLPVDHQRMLVDYANPEFGKTILEVRAFGQGQVLVDGRIIDRWEGQLPRTLFFFFVDRAMITRDEIFRIFWPQLPVREATNVFHVTKRKISEILGTSLTAYTAGFYRIAPEIDLHYDVVNFQEAIQEAAVTEDMDIREELYRIAMDLYREEFLSSVESDWAVRRRDEMRNAYTDALIGLGRIYERSGALQRALGVFLRAAGVAPAREDLTRSIMSLYGQLGRPELAVEAYNRLKEMLKKSLNVLPDPQTDLLMQQIRQEYEGDNR